MWNSAHDAYVETRVLAADPLELVRLLYQTAIGSVRDARRFLVEGKIAERSRSISKACDIVIELNAALDHARGGQISRRLAALYEYILHRLLEANQKQNDQPLADVLGLLSTLSEAWEGIRPAAEPAAPAPAPPTPWSLQEEPPTACASQAWSF